MRFHMELYLVILGTFLYFTLVLNERRELEGYKFPVYSTPFCPRNKSEWNKRSTALNCNVTNGYTCLPNQQLTELLEFCYTEPRIWVEAGKCLSLVKSVSKVLVNGHSCHNFTHGCHNASFLSDRIYEYPACISLGNGCFLAEPPCKKSDNFSNLHENGSVNIKEDSTITHIYPQQSTEQTHAGNPSTNDKEEIILTAILLGTIIPCVLFVLCSCYVFHKRKFQICKRHGYVESSEKEKLAQSTEQRELHYIDTIDTVHEAEEIEMLIHESQHSDENSERHEVDMLTRNKNKTCQSTSPEHSVRNRNSKECLTEETLAQSFENNQLVPIKIPAPLKEACCTYQKNSAIDRNEDETIKLPFDHNQLIGRNAENHEGEMLNKNKNMIYQACCTYQKNSAIDRNEDETVKLPFDHYQLIGRNAENHEKEMLNKNKNMIYQESPTEKALLDDWNQEDSCFIFTKACKEVEKLIKSKNLVIVAGHSGSGKSAIIQHIALQYRKLGWKVKRVKEVKDIVDEYCSTPFQKNKTLCIFNDPIGKESFDEMLNNSWQTYEEELKFFFKKSKLMMSCRSHIIYDTRVTRSIVNQSDIIDIDNDENKLSINEKRKILTKYTSDMNLSDNECDQIVKIEKYFPLLCNLYSNVHNSNKPAIVFFSEPRKVLENDIRGFRKKDKEKYCALVLLVLFNNDLCLSYLLKYTERETKYKHALKLCGLPESTPPSEIRDTLESLKGFFVKKIGDTYHFHHDFVMEVTTHVFGTDYPADIIQHADIGLLRRRVKVEDFNEKNDAFTIHISDRCVEELADRLFSELIGSRFLDVVLNPCLRNEKVIEALRQIMKNNPEDLETVLKNKELKIDKEVLDPKSKDLVLSKLSFLELQMDVSPLFALIVFCHTELSIHCLNTLQQIETNINPSSLFLAVCINGSLSMFETFPQDSMAKIWHDLYPIHIVSLFHNYEILDKLIETGEDVNRKTDHDEYSSWTPLMLASCNDCNENEINNSKVSSETRRNKTVEVLLNNGADINISCTIHRYSPLFLACQNGYDSTVNILLRKEASVNVCTKDGSSPLFKACQNGHDGTVNLLLNNGAKINLCKKNGVSPLFIACRRGHNSIVKLLLQKKADVNLASAFGVSPLIAACSNGHDATAQLLLSNGADINIYIKDEQSALFEACLNGHESTVKLLLDNGAEINLCRKGTCRPIEGACYNGHENIVKILLQNGANPNLCNENGISPLYLACLFGHKCIVHLLLSNGADVNLCEKEQASPLSAASFNGNDSIVRLLLINEADINIGMEDGLSPLYMACQDGHDSTVQLLLSNGADINLCNKNGTIPLHIACEKGNVSTVELLLRNGADINLWKKNGATPLFIACQNGHQSTVELLLSNGADINLCEEDGASPIYIACQNGHDSTVQLLLSNGADINLCEGDGASPLYIACQNGHDSTVQLLVSNEADINLCKRDEISPLHIACQKGNVSTVQLLMTKGADINLCMEGGKSPLLVACLSKQYHIIKLLLKNGADTNSCLKNGPGPLYLVCSNGHDETAQLLLNYGANINSGGEHYSSPLYVASLNGHYSTVQLLLSNGANINACNKNGFDLVCAGCVMGHENTAQPSPLRISCFTGQYRIAQLLISKGADVNLCLEDGISPLYEACETKNDSIVQLLLSTGANVNLSKRDGCSPLHAACKTGHDITVQLLLRNGAEVNLCRQYIVSPLFIACSYGYNKIVKLLLSNGAGTNLCFKDGTSSLYIACCNGHEETVQILISNGADVNLCREGARSPLYVACENGHDSIVHLLVRNGADINLSDSHKISPLYIACQNGHERTVKILLRKDADINLCQTNGISPLNTACAFGHDDIVQLLLRNGADLNLCMNDGVSPLYIAFGCRCYRTVNILLNNGVDTSLNCGWEVNPDLKGCFDDNDSTVKFLRRRDNILCNMYDLDSYFSFFVWCQIERVTRMIFDE